MQNLTYMRKYSKKLDFDRYHYNATEMITYLTTKKITVPTYQLFGGKKHKQRALIATDFVNIATHMIGPFILPISAPWVAYKLYEQNKHHKEYKKKYFKDNNL